MMAFVDAMAGMIFFTTPCVKDQFTPSMLNCFARSRAAVYNQLICSGSSVSSFLSAMKLAELPSTMQKHVYGPPCTRGHSSTDAHSMQCSGNRGVFAIVQMGKAVGLFSKSKEHS